MGNCIIIKYPDGYSTFYSHLKSISVKPGNKKEKSQAIGQAESTDILDCPIHSL
jgi:murein DD-endopeptidase MepM/ murein hydrolase activator NlpD